MLSAEKLAEFLNQLGIYAIFGSLVISIIIAIAGILPSIFITGANVILFGPYYGLFISWVGEVAGAVVSFYLYRSGFKIRADRISEKYTLLKKMIASNGSQAGWLVFEARLFPFIPSGFVTLAASISSINIRTFLVATAFGKLPSIALEALISYDIINLYKNWLRLIIIVIAILILVITLRKKK